MNIKNKVDSGHITEYHYINIYVYNNIILSNININIVNIVIIKITMIIHYTIDRPLALLTIRSEWLMLLRA